MSLSQGSDLDPTQNPFDCTENLAQKSTHPSRLAAVIAANKCSTDCFCVDSLEYKCRANLSNFEIMKLVFSFPFTVMHFSCWSMTLNSNTVNLNVRFQCTKRKCQRHRLIFMEQQCQMIVCADI